METRLSALLDGELDQDESALVLDMLRQPGDAHEAVGIYHLIGDALRGEPRLDADLTASVMTMLAQEPTVLAPRIRRHRLRPAALALAASAAGVAVVAWLALAPQAQTDQLTRPQAMVPVQVASSRGLVTQEASPDMQEYLIAHQLHSSTLGLGSSVREIRPVSFSVAGAGK
ncbi:sigma-E factor negative regulatory protein [Denitratisoma oestradiolicum]|uniref:Anti sigma-E protein RseA N-terminal domain-containing protein n=1 Tax=Denitratisoma oestradiolicum TaxID=311182 RepID=A0A6S6XYC9_9PROT|nr:RseA family anti-sigma factor [Denitratisoma oestradiolicum]TWO80272.1 hypothetical protein CBW56_10700 [Denitratisoma oestradiolicum]CAB1369367.1 conserved protein of unknown function [Denitratisoma oestradiolicum]